MPLFNTRPKSTNPAESPPDSATKVTNSLSTTAAEIVPANLNRKFITVSNPLDIFAYIDFDAAVSSTDYMMVLSPGDYVELPVLQYGTDALHGILSSGTGSLLIREFT